VITDDKMQVISKHKDKDDITYQYVVALGDYDGGELTVWSPDGSTKESCNIHNRIVRLDGRCAHQVEPVTRGHRYIVYFFKCFDRRPAYEQIAPVRGGVTQVYPSFTWKRFEGFERPAKRARV
jgi:hypothetical protein